MLVTDTAVMVAVMSRVALAPFARVPSDQTPEVWSYEPMLGVELT